MADLPKFENPPVTEVVLSLQFAPLTGLTPAHIGWYWRDCLGDEWPNVSSATHLDDAFSERHQWSPPRSLKVLSVPDPPRIQFTQANDERMIQVQDSRFVYNWRKRSEGYPSFDSLLPQFDRKFSQFREFISRARIGSVELNQWEVTYVDHILKDALWQSPSEWSRVSPLFAFPTAPNDQSLETLKFDWRLRIGDSAARLYIDANHVRVGGAEGPEAIAMKFTARGPVDTDFKAGLELGHKHCVTAFKNMTTPEAHKHWKLSH